MQPGRRGWAVVKVATTGLHAHHDRVVRVSVVRVSPLLKLCERAEWLVDPGVRPIGGFAVHRISGDMLIGQPTFADIAPDVGRAIAGCTLAGHFLTFDRAMLDDELGRAQLGAMPLRGLCTYRLAQQVMPAAGNLRLVTLARLLGVSAPPVGAGRVWGGVETAEVTAEVLVTLLRRLT